MAGPQKTTGDKINLRVAQGSALERLLVGRTITETVHKLAELVEQGPPAVLALLPAKGVGSVQRVEAAPPPPAVVVPARVERLQVFQIGSGRHTEVVSEAQVLEIARGQYPAGLVPIGLDEGDDFGDAPKQTEQTDDLSYLA